MRLIDADAFIEDIKTEIVNLAMDGMKGTPRPREELYQIIDRISEQPTAYDVEKVVEQIKEKKCTKCRNRRKATDNKEYCKDLNCEIEEVCEIVRGGRE